MGLVTKVEATLMFKRKDENEVKQRLTELLGANHGVVLETKRDPQVGDVVLVELLGLNEDEVDSCFVGLTYAGRMRYSMFDYESLSGYSSDVEDEVVTDSFSDQIHEYCEY